MSGLGLKDFLNAFGCKHVFYVHKADRGVSISTTYLLSDFQAIPVRPWSSRWARSKVRALKYIEPSMFLNWMLFLLIILIFFTHVIGKLSSKKKSHGKDFGYFSANFKKKNQSHCLRHILWMALTTWASGSMVFILGVWLSSLFSLFLRACTSPWQAGLQIAKALILQSLYITLSQPCQKLHPSSDTSPQIPAASLRVFRSTQKQK